MSMISKRSLLSGALVGALFTVLVGTEAWAIPAFARKYQTSCQTCHIAALVHNSRSRSTIVLYSRIRGSP